MKGLLADPPEITSGGDANGGDEDASDDADASDDGDANDGDDEPPWSFQWWHDQPLPQ